MDPDINPYDISAPRSFLNPGNSAKIENFLNAVDVEQSLLALTIEKFNQMNQSNVKFGAVNIITDKPVAVLSGTKEANGLDSIDHSKKQSARESAVQLAINGILKNSAIRIHSCSKAHTNNF